MALRHGLFVSGASGGVTSPQDARLALAGLLTGPGLLNGFAVTGSTSGPNMKYPVSAGVAVTQRGTLAADGLYLLANDGPVTVDSGSPAPGSGTRWDLVWVRQPNAFDGGFGDSNSDPVFGVTVGTAGSSPTKPYASVPAGALVLAEVLVGTSIASASLATITLVAASSSTVYKPADTNWLNITNLASGWTQDSQPAQVRQIGDDIIFQGGLVDTIFSTTSFLTAATIPAGIALPTSTKVFPMFGGSVNRGARILTTGEIQFYANGAGTFSYRLDHMRYHKT